MMGKKIKKCNYKCEVVFIIYRVYFFLIYIFIITNNLYPQNLKSLQIIKPIADRIISETSFTLEDVQQKPAAFLQVIDFKKALDKETVDCAYAFSYIAVENKEKFKFGISYLQPLKIWINNKLIYKSSKSFNLLFFKEIAYSIFSFQDTFSICLKKGLNKIVIESYNAKHQIIYLRELTPPQQNPISKFLPICNLNNYTWTWCFLPIDSSKKQEILIDSIFSKIISKKYACNIPEPSIIKRLAISINNTFNKDSYADWNYANGILMLSLINFSKAIGDEYYLNFVKKYCDFIYKNLDLFKKQYYIDHDIRGSYYRIFRRGMLDDTGGPILPFVELKMMLMNSDYDTLINNMINYVFHEQTRLNDGTLCRPEPEEWTVWADDMFMSVPLLMRAGVLYKDKKYFDEATKQIINFNKYLFDSKIGLYKHGWFSRTNKKSKVYWGRANGWVIWATSEALKFLPKDHPAYKRVKKIFVTHLKGILKYQEESGMWHQILDDKSSFEETSCTAMFIVGLSHGIINGMIDKKYSANVFKAWHALQNKIDSTGIVKDICCGTGIGTSADFYKEREKFNNDPRGLGAVIKAGIEIVALEKYIQE